ncbi:hypothetical protein ACFOEK_05160 [Litoribrevibacter euphylliae]|uniref:Uncharacterized protein n=1 Tax=Litoribrevibacter euphylliae TaxID=1834034 RepID=A0ABV7HCH6_9GAMM
MAEEEKEELTEEQQIQLLQKKNNSLKMVVTVLSGLSFILLLGVGTLSYLLADSPSVEFATTTETEELKNTLAVQQANLEKLSAQLQLLEAQRISASGIPRDAAIESQRDFLRLVHIMQNSMRDESRMIKGARSWYEHYNQLLNTLRQKGKERLTQLGSTEPNMSEGSKSQTKDEDFGDSLF